MKQRKFKETKRNKIIKVDCGGFEKRQWKEAYKTLKQTHSHNLVCFLYNSKKIGFFHAFMIFMKNIIWVKNIFFTQFLISYFYFSSFRGKIKSSALQHSSIFRYFSKVSMSSTQTVYISNVNSPSQTNENETRTSSWDDVTIHRHASSERKIK